MSMAHQALSLLLDKVNHLEQLIASQRKLRFFASFRLRLIKKLITLFFCFATHQHPYPTIHSKDHHYSQIASQYTPQKASPPMAIIANIRSHNFALSDISHLTTIPFQLTGLMNLICSGLSETEKPFLHS